MKKYTLFMGLFDKDSHAQEINTIDAYKITSNLVIKTFGFGTVSEAVGFYTHEDGTQVQEPTVRIELNGADEIKVKGLVDNLKVLFNQESIFVEIQEINGGLW